MACIIHDVEVGVETCEGKHIVAEPHSKRRITRRRAILLFGLLSASALAAVALLIDEREDLSPTFDAARKHHHTVSRELLITLEQALHHEVNVEVEVTFGDVNLSRQVLFGDMDSRAIYASYNNDTHRFWDALRKVQKQQFKTLNFVIAKADSHISVNGTVAAFNLDFTGAVNVRYKAVAFDGDGELDRTGKNGGFRNWYFEGVWQREDMHVTFFTSGDSRDSGTCENNGA